MGVANMETLTISQIKRAALEGRVEAVVHGQVDTLLKKETKEATPPAQGTPAQLPPAQLPPA